MHFNSPILKYTHPILKYIIEKYKYEKQDIIYINQNTNNNGYDIDNNINDNFNNYAFQQNNDYIASYDNFAYLEDIYVYGLNSVTKETFFNISNNPNLSFNTIIENKTFNWNISGYSNNKNLTIDILINSGLEFDWYVVTKNPAISINEIYSNNLKWNNEAIEKHPEFIIYNNIYDKCNELLNFIEVLPLYKLDIVIKYLYEKNKIWEYIKEISKNFNIDVEYIKNNNYIKPNEWDSVISENPNIDINFIRNNPDIKWDATLLKNINIDFDIYNNNLDIINKYIKHIYSKHKYNVLFSENPNITWDIVINNNSFPWDYNGLSLNPNITYNILKENLDKPWNYEKLMSNQFCHHYYYKTEIYKKRLVKKFMDNCWEELIQKACHPSRIENWNEGYLEMFS